MACWWDLRCLDAIDAAPTPGPAHAGASVVEPLALLEHVPSAGLPEDGGEGSALLMARLGPAIDDLFWATTCGAGFSGETVLHIARSMRNALAGVAEADLVHGDCKPSNFLVSDKDEIILTDFGTCRERGAPSSDSSVFKLILVFSKA